MLEICPLSELPPGEARRVDAEPPIAVFHTEDGEVFAIDDTCSHQDASLADGWLEGCEVECPLHASRFDLRTGAVDAPPAKRPVRTHAVVIDGRRHPRRAELRRRPTCRRISVHAWPRGRPREARSRSSGRRWRACRPPGRCAGRASTGAMTLIGDEITAALRPPAAVEGVPRRTAWSRPTWRSKPTTRTSQAEWLLGAAATGSTPARGCNRTRRRHVGSMPTAWSSRPDRGPVAGPDASDWPACT